jgi:hypothetical protein
MLTTHFAVGGYVTRNDRNALGHRFVRREGKRFKVRVRNEAARAGIEICKRLLICDWANKIDSSRISTSIEHPLQAAKSFLPPPASNDLQGRKARVRGERHC